MILNAQVNPDAYRYGRRQKLSKPKVSKTVDKLSTRQKQMIALLLQEKSNKEIAWDMGITPLTARFYMSQIIKRLDVHSRVGVVLWALQNKSENGDIMRDEKLLLASIALAAKRIVDSRKPAKDGDYTVSGEAMDNLRFAIRVFVGTPEDSNTST